MRQAVLDAASRRARARLEEVILSHGGETFASISLLLRRNHAYVQQHIVRGSPRFLSSDDIAVIANYFSVPMRDFLPPGTAAQTGTATTTVALAATASPEGEKLPSTTFDFPIRFLDRFAGIKPSTLRMLQVVGDAMLPTLAPGDHVLFLQDPDALTATNSGVIGLTDALYVLSIGGEWQVKRVQLEPTSGLANILSDNRQYPPRHGIDPACLTVGGRVIWTGRTL